MRDKNMEEAIWTLYYTLALNAYHVKRMVERTDSDVARRHLLTAQEHLESALQALSDATEG